MSQGLGANFDAAQRAYDAQMPEDDDDPCAEECPTCDGEGIVKTDKPASDYPDGNNTETCPDCKGEGVKFNHNRLMRRGEAKDGTRFAKCTRCGKVVES